MQSWSFHQRQQQRVRRYDLAGTREVLIFLRNKVNCCTGPATDALIQAAALESAQVVFEFGCG